MRFYYFSVFGTLAAAIASALALVVFWLIWTKVLDRKLSARMVLISTAVMFALPWTEELWIAYKFDQFCRKDAGLFIHKTVEVEGFYDETRPGRPGALAEQAKKSMDQSGYQFYERPISNPYGGPSKVVRFEKVDGQWISRTLDRPTARYHYKTLNSHAPVAHQIKRFEDVVIDVQTGEVLGRFVNYYRGAYWFFISSGRPTIPCAESQAGIRKYGSLIYNEVLKPLR